MRDEGSPGALRSVVWDSLHARSSRKPQYPVLYTHALLPSGFADEARKPNSRTLEHVIFPRCLRSGRHLLPLWCHLGLHWLMPTAEARHQRRPGLRTGRRRHPIRRLLLHLQSRGYRRYRPKPELAAAGTVVFRRSEGGKKEERSARAPSPGNRAILTKDAALPLPGRRAKAA